MKKPFKVSVISFGYKHGLPANTDLMFDVRFLSNPFYHKKLQLLSGNDKPVQDFVFKQSAAKKFLKLIFPLLNFTLSQFQKKGRRHVTIAVGCTGGRHRSIALANKIYQFLTQKKYRVSVEHRDINR